MSLFANMKKKTNTLADLAKAAEAISGNKNYNDDTLWKLKLDKSSNGYAVIRFLPTPPQDQAINEDALPWTKYWDHGFQGPTGQWYIQKCLTSIGQPDPVCDFNTELYNSGLEANKDIAKRQKRRLHYVSNIYVVKDPASPENEGKVFKFVYGKKIFERLTQAMKPQFEDDMAFDPFNLWKGANFKLKARKVDGNVNYDLSEWAAPAPLLDDDVKLEKVFNQEHSLIEILDPKNFKTYAELETLLKRVLNLTQQKSKFTSAVEATKTQLDLDEDVPFTFENKPKSAIIMTDDSEEDDDLSYFSKLVDED